jgi:hypothetical protein
MGEALERFFEDSNHTRRVHEAFRARAAKEAARAICIQIETSPETVYALVLGTCLWFTNESFALIYGTTENFSSFQVYGWNEPHSMRLCE